MSAVAQPSASPVEFVRGLPPEGKQAVLLALLREAQAINGECGLIPIEDEDGRRFGYYVPPQAADALADAVLPRTTAEREAEIERRLNNPGPTIRAEDLLAEFKAAASRPLQRQ